MDPSSSSMPDESQGEDRSQSFSAASESSQTAAEFINSQLQLEADAREALPYKFDTCTQPLGPLRQLLFACLTCNPPPAAPAQVYEPAAVCYSCSVSCHGEHTLVELFNKRDFVCDCGTTRMPSTSPCSLRLNPLTNTKGDVVSERAAPDNKYNHNFQNKFCGCECDYDPHQQKGTMFQCLGLGTAEDGGCGEDWWHPSCLVGLGPEWMEQQTAVKRLENKPDGFLATLSEVAPAVAQSQGAGVEKEESTGGFLDTITDVASAVIDGRGTLQSPVGENEAEDGEDDDPPPPPGFPHEDDFDGFICYKCVDANPWIKKYADTPGFLGPVFRRSAAPSPEASTIKNQTLSELAASVSNKRKATEEVEDSEDTNRLKRIKDDADLNFKSIDSATTGTLDKNSEIHAAAESSNCKYESLPTPPPEQVSLFFKSDFRDHLCRCSNCFPNLAKHSQLLDEEETYEPPISESAGDDAASTVGSGSIYERGESVLKNVDRVKAIEGVMAYNHLKEKLTPFFKEFAESGKAISAEDIKAHFAKMRGDAEGIKDAGEAASRDGTNRKEQSGY